MYMYIQQTKLEYSAISARALRPTHYALLHSTRHQPPSHAPSQHTRRFSGGRGGGDETATRVGPPGLEGINELVPTGVVAHLGPANARERGAVRLSSLMQPSMKPERRHSPAAAAGRLCVAMAARFLLPAAELLTS